MSMHDAGSYNELEIRFVHCLKEWEPAISRVALDHVSYYIDHGELAMAVESFVLSCVAETVPCPNDLKSMLLSVCTELALGTESVFDSGFCGKLCAYLER